MWLLEPYVGDLAAKERQIADRAHQAARRARKQAEDSLGGVG